MCSDHRGRAPPLYSPLPSFYSQLVPLPHVCHKSPSQNTPCGGLKRWSSPHGATHPPPATLPASHPPRHLLYRLICAPQSYRDLIYSTQLSLKMLLFDRVAGEVWGGGAQRERIWPRQSGLAAAPILSRWTLGLKEIVREICIVVIKG